MDFKTILRVFHAIQTADIATLEKWKALAMTYSVPPDDDATNMALEAIWQELDMMRKWREEVGDM